MSTKQTLTTATGFLAMAIGIVMMAFGVYACNDPALTESRQTTFGASAGLGGAALTFVLSRRLMRHGESTTAS